jgi:hypothetical protein
MPRQKIKKIKKKKRKKKVDYVGFNGHVNKSLAQMTKSKIKTCCTKTGGYVGLNGHEKKKRRTCCQGGATHLHS